MEIELKLTLDPAAVRAFRASPLLASARPSRQRVITAYFDTPDCLLARSHMALRLCKAGRRWLQTLKTAGPPVGGLHQRDAWEFARPDAVLDLAHFRETPLAMLPDATTLHERLQPVFSTDCTRTRWIVAPEPGQRIAVALDVGDIRCGDRSEALCEVELALLAGSPDALISLGLALAAVHPLMPAHAVCASKAERGYRLFRNAPLTAVKAQPVKLAPKWPPRRALQALVLAGLDHFLSNHAGALTGEDPEFIHQLRVALRRLRLVLRMFRVDDFNDELKWLAGALGGARDWDVFRTEVWPPLERAFTAAGGDPAALAAVALAAHEAGLRVRASMRLALTSPRAARCLLALMRFAAVVTDAAVVVDAQAPIEVLSDFASRQIRRRRRRLLHGASGFAGMTAAARHQLRIEVKKLRYAVDCFADLYRRDRTDPWLAALASLQSIMGEANDAATALDFLAHLAPAEPLRLFAQGWFAARALAHADEVDRHLHHLASMRRFWHRSK